MNPPKRGKLGRCLVQFQYCQEGFLWYLNISYLFHAFLAPLLFLKKFTLTADIAAVTLGKDILADLLNGFTGYYLGTDGCLNGYIELLPREQLFKLFTHTPSESLGIVEMGQRR